MANGVFTEFIEDDIVEGQLSIVSSGMWSGGVGTLTAFHTSSTQSGSTGEHYYDVFQGVVGTDATASVQFSVTYGHFAGSGSKSGDSDVKASKAIYRQLRNILLPPGSTQFKVGAAEKSLAILEQQKKFGKLKYRKSDFINNPKYYKKT